jgi:hypothetical protein
VTSVSRFSAGVAVRSATKSTFDVEICHQCIWGHGPHLQRQDRKGLQYLENYRAVRQDFAFAISRWPVPHGGA